MNMSKGMQKLFPLNQRFFSSSLYTYTNRGNPKVYLSVSKDGNSLGDLVFELYANHAPRSADNFIQLCTGNNAHGRSLTGTTFDSGFPGIHVTGGSISECNGAADGGRMCDENLTLRHHKRG